MRIKNARQSNCSSGQRVYIFKLVLLRQNRGMRGSQTGDRHAEGRAGHVAQANVVAEHNGRRISAMLTADAQLDVGAGLAAQLGSQLNQLAHAVLIQTGEGIGLADLLVVVGVQELDSKIFLS